MHYLKFYVWTYASLSCYETIGKRYFLSVVDDFSRGTWTYLLKYKSQVCSTLYKFLAYVKNQFEVYLKMIRSDNGGEFFFELLSKDVC